MAELAPVPDTEELEQLELFENVPVHVYSAALGSAADIDVDQALPLKQRVKFRGEGVVTKVTFHDSKGKTKRIAIINVEEINLKAE